MALARVVVLAAVLIWGWTFVATKVALGQLAPVELLALRFCIALPFVGILVVVRRARVSFTTHGRALSAASALFALHFVIQVTGLQYTTATNTGWIIALTPLVLAAGAGLLLREKLEPRMQAGMAVATVGILVLVSHGRFTELDWLRSAGDWLVLASTFTWALYTIATRDVAREQDPLAVTFVVLLPATLIFGSMTLAQGGWRKLPLLTQESWLAVLFLALPGTALAQWFWQVGLGRLGAARAGVFLYLEPLATTALAVPYLGETLTLSTVVGGGLVVGGVALAQHRSRRTRVEAGAPPVEGREGATSALPHAPIKDRDAAGDRGASGA